MTGEKCAVYIIAHAPGDGFLHGPVKVGIAKDPTYRVLEIQIGNPRELQVAASFDFPDRATARNVEQSFHKRQTAAALKGEWFDLDVISAISLLCGHIREFLHAHRLVEPDESDDEVGVSFYEAKVWRHQREAAN